MLLGIAFAANGGGIATLVGTPPNGVLAGQPSLHGEVGFANWFLFAAPIACCTLLIALAVLHFGVLRGDRPSRRRGHERHVLQLALERARTPLSSAAFSHVPLSSAVFASLVSTRCSGVHCTSPPRGWRLHSVGVRLSLDEQSLRAQLEDLEAEDVLVSSSLRDRTRTQPHSAVSTGTIVLASLIVPRCALKTLHKTVLPP